MLLCPALSVHHWVWVLWFPPSLHFGKCSQIETLQKHIGDELWELVLAEPTGLGQWFCYFALSTQHPFMGIYKLFLL